MATQLKPSPLLLPSNPRLPRR
uniref:Uncharacterized protein n=1 Tax=Arundo donax TaxID=35708 RepID=A0A0A8XTC8_ARUDO